MKRALIVAPGRGSYDRAGLGQLKGRASALLDACDAYRTSQGRKTIRDLDAAESYRSTLHVAGENASLLTFACSMADLGDLNRESYEVVGVVGNSMGFYTALAASGGLPLEHAIALVDTMGSYQIRNVIGGQVLYPMTGPDWHVDPKKRAAVETALRSVQDAGHVAEWSIELGGFAVLGADKAGLPLLMKALPKEERGARTFPIQLPLHSAFHTSLMNDTASRAQAELAGLQFQAPDIPLIDGRGHVFRPRWSDPNELAAYTLGHQVTDPFDFTRGVQTALEYCAPDVVIALGPGNALGGPLARTLVERHWRGIQDKASFVDAQNSDDPVLLSFGVDEQRQRLVR